MADTAYASVTWTAGDVITEAKLDSMVANDRAYDAHSDGILLTERTAPSTPSANNIHLYAKDDGSTTKIYTKDDAGTEKLISGERKTFYYNGFTNNTALDNATSIYSVTINETGTYECYFQINISNNGSNSNSVRFVKVGLYKNGSTGTLLCAPLSTISNIATGTEYTTIHGIASNISITASETLDLFFNTSASNGTCQLVNLDLGSYFLVKKIDDEETISTT